MKEILVVGASAAVGEFLVQRYGNQIQAKAVELHIPPMVAHVAVVGGFAVLGYVVLRAVL